MIHGRHEEISVNGFCLSYPDSENSLIPSSSLIHREEEVTDISVYPFNVSALEDYGKRSGLCRVDRLDVQFV